MRGQHRDMFVGWFEAGIVGLNRGAGLVALIRLPVPCDFRMGVHVLDVVYCLLWFGVWFGFPFCCLEQFA